MRSLFFFLLVGFAMTLVFAQAFKANFEKKIERRVAETIASSTLSAPKPTPTEEKPAPVTPPRDFQGPIGNPYIIGPTENPPNR